MKTIMLLTAALIAGTPAMAEERYEELASCIAYFAIENGVDGKSAVDDETSDVIAGMVNEFMFEASVKGVDDDTAHTAIVDELVLMNMVVREGGTQLLTQRYQTTCDKVISEIKGGDPS